MKQIFLLAALGVIASGCVLTISPLLDESDAVFDEQLLGTWRSADGDTARVAQRGNEYVISYKSSKLESGQFGGRMGRLADMDVLIVWPEPSEDELSEPYRSVMVPGYTIFGIEVLDDRITTTLLDADTLVAAVSAGDVDLTLSEEDDRLVVGDPTPRLQTAFGAYLQRPGSLGDPDEWVRVE